MNQSAFEAQRDTTGGMRAFTVVWIGQLVSLVGTAMAQFGLTIWAYQLTGQATALALAAFFNFVPVLLVTPFAGALVDRWNRKLVMALSDLGAGLATVAVFLLYAAGSLEIWHLYAAGVVTGAFQAFQFPAYSAAISLMLDKKDYGRASGMLQLAEGASGILAPPLAGFLLALIQLQGVLLIDIVTFIIALLALWAVPIPQPARDPAAPHAQNTLWQDAAFGFRYIFARPSLLGLQSVFFCINLLGSFIGVLITPMILERSGQNEALLGLVLSAAGIGGVVGSLWMSVRGGTPRRVDGVLGGMLLSSLFGVVLMSLGSGLALPLNLAVWWAASFGFAFCLPLINGSNQALWQAKVPPTLQGRVFAARLIIARITVPVALILTGPLTDQVFEPGMQPGGALAGVFGGLLGTGPGAGMALMFLVCGSLGVLVSLGGYLFPAIREAEQRLPDAV
ncbi:MAG: MFS transporter [Anaerolineae bacterium]|jgi:MFS family permease|nr:MFS transporter [Anaerolineae bacterium]